MRKVFFSLFISLVFLSTSTSQQDDPVLFTVDGNDVHVSEFLYIYQKNNGKKADFSESSLNEYLDLYTKFKLKVTKARQMKLDTIPELISELAGYRKQLSKSYLVDKEVNEKLVKEVFERRKRDLNVSHILIISKNEADIEQDALAKAKIFFIHNQLEKGENFGKLAKDNSEDKSSALSGGNLGYITAMLPDGFYAFENEAYKLEKGSYSKPFKTDYGYHIVKLNGDRPARGQVELAHIMIKRQKGESTKSPKIRIDSIYKQLQEGESFEMLAKKHSMDSKTQKKGGYIGMAGINKYEKTFEDVAFGLKEDGEFSAPFESSAGWHIIKRISKPDLFDFEKEKRRIAADIAKDSRFQVAKTVLVEKIKNNAGYKSDTSVLNSFVSQLDPGFFTLYWNMPNDLDKTLFTLGDEAFSLEKFAIYCKQNQRERMKYGKNTDLRLLVNKLFDRYVAERCMAYEEGKLEAKYPDFKSLMREYDEGILLFEATKREVWDKASQDTSGLNTFYAKNKDNYLWRSRADLYKYTIHTDNKKLVNKIYKYASKKGHNKLIDKFNEENQIVSFSRSKVEIGNKELKGMEWEKDAVSSLVFDEDKKTYSFMKIADILPKTPKSLDEAKGYVIADYQEYLEKTWVDSLRKEFEVVLNQEVFNKLIKK